LRGTITQAELNPICDDAQRHSNNDQQKHQTDQQHEGKHLTHGISV
jgi:hypothetical protein